MRDGKKRRRELRVVRGGVESSPTLDILPGPHYSGYGIRELVDRIVLEHGFQQTVHHQEQCLTQLW